MEHIALPFRTAPPAPLLLLHLPTLFRAAPTFRLRSCFTTYRRADRPSSSKSGRRVRTGEAAPRHLPAPGTQHPCHGRPHPPPQSHAPHPHHLPARATPHPRRAGTSHLSPARTTITRAPPTPRGATTARTVGVRRQMQPHDFPSWAFNDTHQRRGCICRIRRPETARQTGLTGQRGKNVGKTRAEGTRLRPARTQKSPYLH